MNPEADGQGGTPEDTRGRSISTPLPHPTDSSVEDAEDLAAAKAAMAEPGPRRPWDEVRKELGLK